MGRACAHTSRFATLVPLTSPDDPLSPNGPVRLIEIGLDRRVAVSALLADGRELQVMITRRQPQAPGSASKLAPMSANDACPSTGVRARSCAAAAAKGYF